MERATHRIERTKQLSVLEGAFWSAMVGVGTYFITPFALLLGASPFAIGLLKSFSTLAGAVGTYLGAWWIQFEKNRKQLLYKFVTIQALLWIPLALLPLVQVYTVLLLIIIYSLITLFGAFVGPAWTSLMRDVVGEKNRARISVNAIKSQVL